MSKILLQEVSSRKTYQVGLPCLIGRGEEVDLSFSDAAISHKHARIEESDNRIWIRDLESANGVYVNGQRIAGKALLKPGDSILFGRTKLLVLEEQEDLSVQTIITHCLGPEVEWNLDHRRLKFIYEITAELSGDLDIKTFGEKVFSRFKGVFQQDRGYLALFQEDGSLKPVFFDPIFESVPVSRTITKRLFQDGESFLLKDALSEDSLKEKESIVGLKIRSALCSPLIYHSQIYGLIYLDRNTPGFYQEDDLAFLRSIAAILAPLVENARLWTELKRHYDNAMETLRETQTRLIDMERKAAYIHLAQAMAHELRNPLVAIGGLIRRMAQPGSEGPKGWKFQAVMVSVERTEMVLKEVDDFVTIPLPQLKLERIDHLIQEEIKKFEQDWQKNGLSPFLSVNTSQVMIPLDCGLFKKALSKLFREIIFDVPQGSMINIVIQDSGNEIEILIGEIDKNRRFCELYDPELHGKPWSLSLFLNIAHRIISDHGGKLLLDTLANSVLPVIVRMPRMIKA